MCIYFVRFVLCASLRSSHQGLSRWHTIKIKRGLSANGARERAHLNTGQTAVGGSDLEIPLATDSFPSEMRSAVPNSVRCCKCHYVTKKAYYGTTSFQVKVSVCNNRQKESLRIDAA